MSLGKKISIITASYNAEEFIERAIQSIVDQQYDNMEYLIIDGGSKDGTVEIIKKYADKINYWISEPDKGIYDAWNKGLAKATGDWIMFLGCDDLLVPGALQYYSDFINQLPENIQYISSKNQIVDIHNNPIRIKGWPWKWPFFLKEMTVAHPGSLHAKKLFEAYGNFNTNYKIVGDYEFLLRPKEQLKTAFMDRITVVMQEGGASDSVAAIKEQYKASTLTGNYSTSKALLNASIVYAKFKSKKALRAAGINAYLRK